MKLKITLIPFFCFVCSHLFAQGEEWGMQASQHNYTQNSASSRDFSFTTYFSFGSPGSCPSFTSAITFSEDSMYVKAFYSVCGAWPMQGCARNDVVNYNQVIPTNIQFIVMSTNVITACETGTPVTVENVYTSTYNANLGIETFSNSSIKIYPNPVNNLLTVENTNNEAVEKIIITDCLGKKVIEMTQNFEQINVSMLPSGLYFLQCFSQTNKTQSKFVKL
ncbi:T9SS type A sorting domain-containing protein [Flavobacterium buctense]|uniref:T9SS type A sorting domain-containing protein n=1 Tax=Flavobacterium buctense TaxID=1648146 RepID=A0ABU9E4J3_9FLAO|nr:T9SS type A sorting domain-containing protein [Flavobacterium buctense]